MMITNASGRQHEVSGLFATVSFDEGKSWPHQRLVTDDGPARQVGSLNGEPVIMSPHNTESVGYLTVCQTPDGVVNLLTSKPADELAALCFQSQVGDDATARRADKSDAAGCQDTAREETPRKDVRPFGINGAGRMVCEE
jgi:hypothetical protein